MKHAVSSSLASLLVSWLLVITSAQVSAAYAVPDYNVPAAIIYKNAADDPSLICQHNDFVEEDCQKYFDTASVTCTDDQTFIMSQLEDNPNLNFSTYRNGSIGGQVDHLPNLATDSEEFLSKIADTYIARYANNTFDHANNFGLYESTCMALYGTENYSKEECCKTLGTGKILADGTCQLNSMKTTKAGPRLLTPRQQFEKVYLPNAKLIKKNTCSAIKSENISTCEPNQGCFGKDSISKKEVAQMVPETYEEFKALSEGTRNLIQGCVGTPSNATKPIYLVVLPEQNQQTIESIFNTLICNFLSGVFDIKACQNYIPSVAMMAAPGVVGSKAMIEIESKSITTIKQHQSMAESIEKSLNKPLDWSQISTSRQAAILKANENKNTVTKNIPTYFMGGVFDTGSAVAKSTYAIQPPDLKAAEGKSPFTFRMCFIAPAEIKTQGMMRTTAKNSIGNFMLTLKQRFKTVGMKTGLVSSADGIDYTKNEIDYTNPYPCQNPQNPTGPMITCYPTNPKTIMTGGAPTDTAVIESDASSVIANLARRLLRPIKSDSRHPNTCWYNNEKFGTPNMVALTLGQEAKFNESACEDYFISSSNGGVCNATSHPPRQDASGSCQLCNVSGYPNLPGSLISIFESAGQEFNVPASVLLGIFFGEGGFERVACYGEWTDESVQAAASCGGEVTACRDCNVSGAGALGPFQQIPKYIPPETGGNPCNLYEAARNTAFTVHRGRVGDPSWDDTCDGVDLNNGVGSRSFSCSAWTLEDVATAARAHRGLCDPLFQSRVIEYWNSYTCGSGNVNI
jgi:hypothetical protein